MSGTRLRGLVLVLAGLAFGACAAAPDRRDLRAAIDRGDFETAVHIARQLAAQGHSSARFTIGTAYAQGKGVALDLDEADRWFERYVELRQGRGYPNLYENWEEAVADFYDNAQPYFLAQVVDSERAMVWYARAAAAGSAPALRKLGELHRMGRGAPKDAGKALEYYRRAGEAGYAYGYHQMGELYLSGELGAPDHARAREAFVEGFVRGDSASAEAIGEMHAKGLGGRKDPQLARAWWVVATKMGHSIAPLNIMRLYLRRKIVADTWRSRGLSWGFLALEHTSRSDDQAAGIAAGMEKVAPFSEGEKRAARRLADAFNERNPNWRQGGAPLPGE